MLEVYRSVSFKSVKTKAKEKKTQKNGPHLPSVHHPLFYFLLSIVSICMYCLPVGLQNLCLLPFLSLS